MPAKVPIRTWKWPEKPWTRLHVDHAGPVEGKTIFIIVDAHSKWIDAHVVPSTSATAAIDKLRISFSTHGLPQTIVSDNGSAFTSSEFQQFLSQNGIEHVRSAPYHPSSNGLAERAVQTVKMGVKKLTGPLETRLARFLFKYRVTPQTTTGIAPAELLMGRRLRTHLDLLYPSVEDRVRKQKMALESCKGGLSKKELKVGDRAMCRNFADGPRWLPGSVIERDTATSVRVKLDDGRVWRRHLDHVIPSRAATSEMDQPSSEVPAVPLQLDPGEMPDSSPSPIESREEGQEPVTDAAATSTNSPTSEGGLQPNLQDFERRHSTRVRQPLDRLR